MSSLRRDTVLIVDDNDDIRRFCGHVLRAGGYDVLEAADGFEAMSIVAETAQLALVLSDHDMPGMSGSQLAASVLLMRPQTPFVLMSGQPPAEVAADHDFAPARACIAKPFVASALPQLIQSQLNPRPNT